MSSILKRSLLFGLLMSIWLPCVLGQTWEPGKASPKKLATGNTQMQYKNIARSQMAASNTSHRLSRCQVVPNNKLLAEIVFDPNLNF